MTSVAARAGTCLLVAVLLARSSSLAAQGPTLTGPIAVPIYPMPLLEAGLGGTVVLRVPVDSTGRPEPGRVTADPGSDPSLEAAAIGVAADWRFDPSTITSLDPMRPATVVVHFVVLKDPTIAPGPLPARPELLTRRTDPDSGNVLLFVWPPGDRTAMAPSPEDATTARLLALRGMLIGLDPGADRGRVACVGFGPAAGAPDVTADQMTRLRVPGVTVVAGNGCPPPPAGMPQSGSRSMDDTATREPIRLLAGAVRTWRKGIVLVDGSMGRGALGTSYRCWVDLRGSDPAARCVGSVALSR